MNIRYNIVVVTAEDSLSCQLVIMLISVQFNSLHGHNQFSDMEKIYKN
jgi:hypothetical protein